MRLLRLGRIFAVVLAPVLFGQNGAAETAGGGPDRFGLTYEVYSGGFHVLSVDLELALSDQRYDATTRLHTVGVFGWLLSWSQVSRSAGIIRRDAVAPVSHRSFGEFRGRRRATEIDYEAGEVSAVRLDPPPHEDEDRDEVSEAMRREGVDPISALLGAIHRISAGDPCDGRLRVFDGRRRYDLVLTDRGTRPLGESRISAFAGDAVQCDFVFQPIAGHIRRVVDPEIAKRRIRSGRVFVAHAGGPLVMPVRVEIDGDWGMTIAHLSAVRDAAAPE